MDTTLIYAKTPLGEESVRQSTRVVQRNLRMVLVQVDGKLSAGDLAEKLGNPRLVERALRELAEGGFIVPISEAGKARESAEPPTKKVQVSALSQFSTFGPKSIAAQDSVLNSATSNFSSFGKPILPSSRAPSSEPAVPEKKDAPPIHADPDEKRSPILKWALSGLLGIVLIALLIVIFYPYGTFRPALENAGGRFLQTPVKIGQVAISFLPRPQLRLIDVSLGETGDSRIYEIRIGSPLALLLGSGVLEIPRIDIQGAELPVSRLLDLPMFQPASVANAPTIIVRQLHIEKSQLVARDMNLRDLGGDIKFSPAGSFESASLLAADRSLRIQASPAPNGIALNIDGMGWRPGGAVVFLDALQAKGVLHKDKLFIESFDTAILGGVMKGSWLLDWGGGLAMAGDATLTRLDCNKVGAAFVPSIKLDGEMSGPLRFRANGDNWENMWRNVEATLDAEILRGNLHGVDLGEAARRGARAPVRAGATKFDRLRTAMTLTPAQFAGRNLDLDAGIMSASGYFQATRQGLVESALTVNLQTSTSRIQVPVRISGTLPDLITIAEK